MTTRIAINGFGRIGRCITRVLFDRGGDELQLVAVNDLTDPDTLVHLLRFDSNHGRWRRGVARTEDGFSVEGQPVRVLADPDPARLPWAELGVDLVLECTGRFRTREKAAAHLEAGASRVLISAPGGADVDGTFVYGVNHEDYDPSRHRVVSNASCTTNCLAPVAKVLHEHFGIREGHMLTVHAYTNDQRILDLPHKDLRRARAAGVSMIPTTTGAAKAIGLVLPELKGRLDGAAIRVPTPNVSIVSLTAHVERSTTVEQVNEALRAAAEGPLKGVLGFETEPLVSIDYNGEPRSSVVDAASTQVMGDGTLVHVQAWYDNEWGFSNRMVDMARYLAGRS